MTNNRGNRPGYKARTTQEQAALDKQRVAFRSSCPTCMKHRRTCIVCAGVY